MPHASVVLADAHDRETPLVRAVANCRSAVVNLRGRKTVRDNESPLSSDVKQVNGMGTGVIIDSRGYVLTNYHVVEDVKEIQVTTSQREKTIGQLIAHDPETDLAP
jgi:serine protease Do